MRATSIRLRGKGGKEREKAKEKEKEKEKENSGIVKAIQMQQLHVNHTVLQSTIAERTTKKIKLNQ